MWLKAFRGLPNNRTLRSDRSPFPIPWRRSNSIPGPIHPIVLKSWPSPLVWVRRSGLVSVPATVPVTGIKRERGAAARKGAAKPRLSPQLWAERARQSTPLGNREGRARGGPPRARRPAAANSQREPAGRGDPARALRPQLRGQPGLCRPLPGRRTPFPFDPGYGNRRGTDTKPDRRTHTSGADGATR